MALPKSTSRTENCDEGAILMAAEVDANPGSSVNQQTENILTPEGQLGRWWGGGCGGRQLRTTVGSRAVRLKQDVLRFDIGVEHATIVAVKQRCQKAKCDLLANPRHTSEPLRI